MNKQLSKCAPLVRRVLSVLMIVMLIVSIVVPNIVWAEETSTTTNGYYDANGVWHQGGNGVFTYKDGSLILSKTAKPVAGADNLFEIMLKVSMKQKTSIFSPSSLATVLVIDVSNSMKACDECQSQTSHYNDCSKNTGIIFGSTVSSDETRLYAAKQAAIAFIDAMREDAEEGSGRYVNIVSFADYAENETSGWYDVTTTSGYNAVKNAINALATNGGTNLDDGLGHAIDWFDDEKVSLISKGGKNVVVLSDGKPTYYMNTSGNRQGNGSDSTKAMLDDTILAANTLKSKANVFTICYNASNSSTYSGGPTVGKFLEDSIATPATDDINYAYDADSASELINSFMAIIEIELESAKVTITDPIPDNISISENGLPDGIKYQDGIWSLHGVEPEVEADDEMVTYTYKIVYKVEMDLDKGNVESGKFYPANKQTYVVLSDNEQYEFPVPGIMPTQQEFDVTFNSGDHGSIKGEDKNGNVTFEDVTNGTSTPAPPEVTPDDGWYFVGWTPEVSDKVDGEVTYTAIYSQKQVITVTGNSDTVSYNGTEQTVYGFAVTGLPQGWTVSGIDYSVSGKNANTYTGSFNGTPVIRDENNVIVPSEQYTLVLNEGTLTIEKQDMTITADSDSKEYDGTALTNDGWTVSGVVGSDNVVRVIVTGSQTLVGQSANVASGAVVMNGNADVTANYNITYVDGTLTVEKNLKEITIIANSATKEYDGTPLTDGGYTLDGAGLAQGDVLTVIVEGSQTNAGTGVNKVVSYKVMRGGDDVTSFYSFATPVDGVLTVEKRDLTITADSASKVYDGTVLKDNGWNDTKPVGLAYGDAVVSVIVEGGQLNVGSSLNVASDAVVMRGNNDVTDNYNIVYIDGTLTVSTVGTPITITANSNSKIYDGLPLEDGGFTFTQGVLADGDVLMVEVAGSQTDAGTGTNTVVSYKVMRNGVDVTNFYTFAIPVDGTLTVEKRDLTITADSATKEYDGTELWDSGYEDTPPVGLATTDEILGVMVDGVQTLVGQSANVASDAAIMRGNDDATHNYNIAYVDGTLTVTRNTQTITITAESDTKQYDGFPLTNDSYTFTDGIIHEYDRLIVEVEGSQTNAGSSPNRVVSYKVMRGNEDVTSFYTFATPVDGTLTVTKIETPIIVEAGSNSKEYDGTPLTDDSFYVVNGDVLAPGDEVVAVIEGSQTFVGTSANKVVSIKVMRDGVDVTDNYNIGTPVAGVLEITGKSDEITITADSASKEYDGTPLTNDSYTVNGELADGDELVVVIEGSQTNAGTSENKVVSIKVMRDGVDVTENYTNLHLEDGTLTVTKVDGEIIVTAGSASKEYDGTPLTSDDYTVTGNLVDGEEIVVEIEGSQTYVGSSSNTAVSIKVMRDGVDVTDNYNIGTPIDGVLEITAKANTIVITAASDSKEYDGTALTNGAYTFTQGILAEGDVLVVDVYGNQTFVGTSVNEITSYKVMRGEADVTDNYSIITVDGTLEVTKREVIITADSASKVYDGTALTDNGFTVAGLANGDSVAGVDVVGSQLGVGSSTNVASDAVIMRGAEDVTDCYDITYIDGTLTISAVGTPIIITAGSASKIYDGTPLTNNDFTFTQGVLVAGDELVVVIEGSQTNAGISANKVVSYKVMRGGVDVTSFYTFATSVDGVLEVTKRDVTITASSDSREYDGTELENGSFTADGLAEGEYIDSVTVVGGQTFVGSSTNVVSGAVIMGTEGETTDNYNITYVDGTITVTKKTDDITITADSASKEYDGTPLTNDGFTVTGELANGDEVVVVIEGSQTFVGSSDNVVVSVKVMRDGADVTDNYANLELVDGTLTITKKTDDITITAGSGSKKYDGTPLVSDDFTVNGELAEGDEIVVEIEGSQTFAGSSPNVVISIKVIRDGVDVTDNYENLIPAEGTLTIEKIETPIIITAGSSEKDYDGTPLTDSTYTFTEGVLIEGDELVVVIEGSQTEVGSSANKVVSVKVMRGEVDVTDCYTIELPVDGELVVNAIPETGDNTDITIWNVMMVVSLLILFVLAFTARRKQRAR